MQNVMLILRAIQSAQSMEEAIYNLKQLEVNVELKQVNPAYANLTAEIVYQLRLNNKFRVFIGFSKIAGTSEYTLHGNKIYIDEPHLK